jgi:hypothetical protein
MHDGSIVCIKWVEMHHLIITIKNGLDQVKHIKQASLWLMKTFFMFICCSCVQRCAGVWENGTWGLWQDTWCQLHKTWNTYKIVDKELIFIQFVVETNNIYIGCISFSWVGFAVCPSFALVISLGQNICSVCLHSQITFCLFTISLFSGLTWYC